MSKGNQSLNDLILVESVGIILDDKV